MPMLMTFFIRLPVWPSQRPLRTASAKAFMRSSTPCTSATTSVPSTINDVPFGARKATCSTERFSVVLITSPRNIAAVRSRTPRSAASAKSSCIVSSVTRFFE